MYQNTRKIIHLNWKTDQYFLILLLSSIQVLLTKQEHNKDAFSPSEPRMDRASPERGLGF